MNACKFTEASVQLQHCWGYLSFECYTASILITVAFSVLPVMINKEAHWL